MDSEAEDVDPRQSMRQFIDFVRNFLRALIQGSLFDQLPGNDGQRLQLDRGLQPLLQQALAELERDRHFEFLVEAIDQLDEARLRAHGLYGAQLRAKLAVVEWTLNGLRSIGGRLSFKSLVSAIDTLLGSILDAAGVGKAIAELKDVAAEAVLEA